MARVPRSVTGDIVYHILNRANGRKAIFQDEKDYFDFERVLEVAKKLEFDSTLNPRGKPQKGT